MPVSDPFRLLFVCTANICRSPYAELRARQLLGDTSGISVASAGLRGFEGNPMDSEMATQLRLRGGDPSGFSSRPFSGRALTSSDLVLTFEAEQRKVITETWPGSEKKVFTWSQFTAALDEIASPVGGLRLVGQVVRVAGPARRAGDIPDPFGRGMPAAAVCAVQVDRLLQRTLSSLLADPV